MNQKSENIEDLLPRYIEGKTNIEETALINEWIEEDPTNRLLVENLKSIYLASDLLYIQNDINTEKALAKTKKRLAIDNTKWWKWTQRIAAVMSIPLLICTLLLLKENLKYNSDSASQLAETISVKTNPGMTTELILPDNTKVYLNSESGITYPRTFEGNERTVELVGEAYFDVSKNPEKRFIVKTRNGTNIEVHGTQFNVEAYDYEEKITTTLVEGKVSFNFKDKSKKYKRAIITPNHKIVYDIKDKEIKLLYTNCETETAWKDGKIVFNNTSIEDILHILSKRYNVEFIINNDRLKYNYFTGTFTTQRLERILEYFKISSNIHWRYVESPDIADKRQKIEIF